MSEPLSLMSVDVLPGRAGIRAEVSIDRLRFQAFYEDGRESEWSGWFSVSECPIALVWSAFWVAP